MSSFIVKENEATKEVELYHKKQFIASWAAPTNSESAEAVMLGMLTEAYKWGQHHRSQEIRDSLRKLQVLE